MGLRGDRYGSVQLSDRLANAALSQTFMYRMSGSKHPEDDAGQSH